MFSGEVIVDMALHDDGATFQLLLSNQGSATTPGAIRTATAGTVAIHEISGAISEGPARVLPVTLRPMEVHILRG
jgi:hypothetical protein